MTNASALAGAAPSSHIIIEGMHQQSYQAHPQQSSHNVQYRPLHHTHDTQNRHNSRRHQRNLIPFNDQTCDNWKYLSSTGDNTSATHGTHATPTPPRESNQQKQVIKALRKLYIKSHGSSRYEPNYSVLWLHLNSSNIRIMIHWLLEYMPYIYGFTYKIVRNNIMKLKIIVNDIEPHYIPKILLDRNCR